MLRSVFIGIAVSAMLLMGCQQAAQKAIEQTTGTKVEQKGDGAVITGKDGEKVVVGTQLPDEFKTFPVPDGFALDASSTVTHGQEKMTMAGWMGKGTGQSVAEFYKQKLTADGWTENVSTVEASGGGALIYSKGGKSLWIAIQQGGNSGEIQLSVMYGNSPS